MLRCKGGVIQVDSDDDDDDDDYSRHDHDQGDDVQDVAEEEEHPAEQMMPMVQENQNPLPPSWIVDGKPTGSCKHNEQDFYTFKQQLRLYKPELEDNSAAAWHICLWKSGVATVSNLRALLISSLSS